MVIATKEGETPSLKTDRHLISEVGPRLRFITECGLC
jgi:hypothetical protein